MTPIATVLHISDLHFVEELTAERTWSRRSSRTLFQRSHSFRKLKELRIALDSLQGAQGPKHYDLVLITGDITTDGSEGALRTALEFIGSDEIYRGGEIGRLFARGLKASADRRLLIPGNHDRFGGRPIPFQRLSGAFERELKLPQSYPYSIGYRRPEDRQNPNQWTLLFFVFDTTMPFGARWLPWRRIACGKVTDEECRFLLHEANKLLRTNTIKALGGGEDLKFNPEKSIRIAVLHHHPVLENYELGNPKLSAEGDPLMLMENDDHFVHACFEAGIQLVLFGHQHVKYQVMDTPPPSISRTPFGAPTNIHFLCCPSTLEGTAKHNGFYIYEFNPDSVDIEVFEWTGTSFDLTKRGVAPLHP